jgi:WD40 repeat protein
MAHKGRIVAFAVSADGSRFATVGSDDEVKVWETATGKEVRRWDMRGPVRNLTFTPDGKHLATANADSTSYLLELP